MYQIYYDPVQANVFGGGAKASVTGGLETTLTGLNAKTKYYVGVRAVDAKGNRDQNTKTLYLGLAKNATRPEAWVSYR